MMDNLSDHILCREHLACNLVSTSSVAPVFFFTNDGAHYAEAEQNKNLTVFYLDDHDSSSIQRLLLALNQFLLTSGKDVIFVCKDQPLVELSWQGVAQFTYQLLQVLQLASCRLLLVTSPSNAFASLLNGSALSLTLEAESFQYCVLDADISFWQDPITYFETCFSKVSRQFKLHNNKLFYQQWSRASLALLPQPIRGNVIITGGGGSIGQALAFYLKNELGCQVFLTGRQELDATLSNQLKATGAKAYFRVDCGDQHSMRDMCDYIEKKHGKITSIFHLAGILNDGLFKTKSVDTYLKTLKPKVQGALVIEKLANDFKFDRVVLFSSLSSVIGNVGQTDYAAANAFLNAIAENNNKHSRTQWHSINWGLWQSETGMQMESSHLLQAMPQSKAFNILNQILANQLAITTVYQGAYSLISESISVEVSEKEKNPASTISSMDTVEAWVREIVVKCTKLRDLKNDDYLLEMGVDSIIAINIAAQINQSLSQVDSKNGVAKTLIFQHGTVKDISKHLIENYNQALSMFLEPKVITQQDDVITEGSADDYRDNDVAIIGMAGEFPGAQDISEFWQLLKNGKSAINEIPISRWDWRDNFSIDTTKSGYSYSRHGGFIKDAKLFDAQFFKIAPVQAEKMDPQARRLLHQSYLALADCDFFKNSSTDVGVFTAAMYSHYQNLNSDKELIDSSFAAIANHISYFFDFKGPSLSVDTMCSGSLSALHLAINSLRLGECKSALVGAVNIMSHPGKFRFLSEEKFLSPTGRCHSFGIGADGYVPGEGAVVLVLKLMKDAMKDENKIYGVIRGSSLNSVGHGSAFTVPSAKAQAEVIAKALEQADVSPNKISYIEAHGTGTSLGDPIEIEGLNASYGKENHHICSVGAVKSNIGHLESAAGLASIVKVLLQMHYRTLVPSLFCEIENPYLPLENSHLRLQKNLAVWGKEENCLYAGVSAFGAGGSNAHLILQSPPRLYQRELISKPGHVFNQQTYWAEALGVSKENKKIMPLKGNVDALLLQPHRTECVAPFAMYLDMPKLYICLESQAASVKTLLDNTRHQYVILSENHDWQQSLLSIIESDFTQSPLYLVNVCAYEPDKDLKQFSRLQFDLAKTLGLLNKVVRYQHFTCSGDDKKEFIYTKAYSALFRTLSLEKSNFNMLLVESDILLSDLIKNTEGRFCDDNIPYQHYIFENQAWYQQQYLEDNSPTNMKSPLLKMGGVYLLAGGLGAVGMLIADMLLKHYHATVILLGRSTLTGEKLQRFEKLSFNSGKVEYLVVDINVLSQVEQCITHIIECYGRLDGVIQSTCILNDSLLNEKSFQDFNNVIRSKIEGTINLDEATKKLPLDLFILFSSMSSVFGNVGQADYCVANTYLDHYSNYRTHQANLGARSGVSISINWPIWQVEGLTIDKATVDFICEVTGIRPLNEAEGVSLFDMVLDKKSSARIIPLVGDKEKIKEKLIFKQSLTALSTNEPDKQSVMENLKLIIEKVTKTPSASLTADMQISDLGFNSILLTEMANEIENSFEITVPPSAFFTYNDLTKITDYIFQKLNTVIKAQEPKRSAPIVIQTVKSDESDNDFAIIGLDGLLPGGPDVATFWQSLINNKSAVSRVERWQDGDYHAATIPDVDCFDAKFFGLSNREAMLMDPQHRLFLQTAYNTVLNAGYTPAQLANVGVFVGVQFNDYHALLQQKNLTKHPYAATGNAHAMLANRVSYLFNFHGPSQTIDTACSSALVAINRGLLALKNGECDAVLAGAVSLLIDPAVTDAANTMGILSPHYRCATFDEQADGYVRGEGVGCFLIKRLKDAKAANDTIHAVIKGFAENHGGKANSLTAPNPLAQKRLLLKAYDKSLAKRVSYIETHGTGTKLGDPVEIDALTQAFATLKPDAAKGSIYLGAVKTNVGHLEPAAGIPSIMKVIYALKYKFLPANINFKQQNPFIQLENTPFSLLTESRTWESSEPLVAGISSFGFGGSNAHLILMRYEDEVEDISSERKMRLFTLSARTRNSLNKMRQQLVKFLMREGEMYSLDSLSFTLNIGREHFEHRLAVVCDNLDTLIDALSDEEYSGIETVTVKQVASYQSDVHGVMRAYLQGEQIDRHILYGEISIKKIHLPGYCFDAKSFWFNETNEAALTELL